MRFYKGLKLILCICLIMLVMSTLVLSAFAVRLNGSTVSALGGARTTVSGAVDENSGNSDTAEPASPVITDFEPVLNGVKIHFTACEGAYEYVVYMKNGTSWEAIGSTTDTSFVHNISENNSVYTYTVAAFDSYGKVVASYNEQGWTNTYLSAPVLKKVKNTPDGQSVSWYAVEGAVKYRVYVKNGSSWEHIGTTNLTSFTNTNTESGEVYTYTVRCVDEADNKLTGFYDQEGLSWLFLEVPEIRKITNTATGAKIFWNEINGASKYKIYYKNGKSWKYIGVTSGTSFVHKIKKSNSEYIYNVRAVSENGDTLSNYNKTGKANTYISVPVLKSTKNTTSGIRIKWDKVDGAVKYKVFVRNGSSWKAIGTTKSNTFTHTDVTSGKRYKYTVRCITSNEKSYTSYFSTAGISHIYLSAPGNIKFKVTSKGPEISWSKVTGATNYKVYVKNGAKWNYLGSVKKTSFVHKKAKLNTEYTYKIIATNVNSGYSSGYYTSGVTNTYIAPPEISSVTYNRGYLLKWNAVPGISKYRVYRKTASSSWKKLADVTGTQFLDKTAKTSVLYTYTVRCLDENSKLVSWYSNSDRYYYNGKVAANMIIGNSKSGYSYVSPDGVVCKTEEIRLAVDFLMKYGEGSTPDEKLKNAFMYMARNYPYNRSYDHPKKASDLGPLAIDIFKNKKGNCFRQASALACLARVAGYRARVVVGETVSAASGQFVPHGWTEIYVNGKWLVCDMNAQMRYSYLQYYMLDHHYWTVRPQHRYEVTVSKGKAVWK